MYGITYGNEKVQKWITSLLFSTLSSVFLTQPLQIALTAMFFVSVFRKASDFYQDKVRDENKLDAKATINRSGSLAPFGLAPKTIGNSADNYYMRRERLRERKLKEIVKKLIYQSIFLWILYVTAFSNRELNSYRYQSSLRNLMTNKQTASSIDSVTFQFVYSGENIRLFK
jgi:hypothetical protein